MSEWGWELSSVSGREAARWTVTGCDGRGEDAALTCDVRLEGQYYGEALAARSPGDVPDFALVLRGLDLRRRELDRLAEYLAEWLALPPAALGDQRAGFTCGMGALFDQSLILTVGRRDDTRSAGRPVATLAYGVGRMRGEMSYVIDHRCLGRLAAGIARALEHGA
jgi:hypothetical protein